MSQIISEKTVIIIKTDWHNTSCSNCNLMKIDGYNNDKYICNCCKIDSCNGYCDGKSCFYKRWPDDNPLNTEIILEYVFKQQVRYIRCVDNKSMNWLPLVNSTAETFVGTPGNIYISANLMSNLINATPITDIQVVYPDYSKVDVGEGITWPAKVFAPYVDTTAWPSYDIVDNYKKTGVKFYNLGFIVAKGYTICEPSWGTYYLPDDAPINPQIKALRALGGDVCVSFGGSSGEPLHMNAPDINTIFKQYQLFCDAYGLTRIDFDIEGNWIDAVYANQNLNNSKALKMLQDYFKEKGKSIAIWFTLPILPTGLTADGLRILQQAISSGVDIGGVNAMTMDYGDTAAPDPSGKMGMYGINAITALKNQLNRLYGGTKTEAQLWAMIGTTPMLGVNDITTEIFSQSDATQTLGFANQNNIGMISMWSANRDATGRAATGIPQIPNEFTNIFKVYTE